MARFFTSINGSETDGEKLLYNKFKNYLPDDFLIWHNIVIPPKAHELDFVILHQTFGLWIVEVKDWDLDKIIRADAHNVEIKKFSLLKQKFRNPFFQARENWKMLMEGLSKHAELLHPSGGTHEGKLIFPVNYFIALPKIRESEFLARKFGNTLPSDRILFKNFIDMPNDWDKKLVSMRDKAFDSNLSLFQMNLIQTFLGVPAIGSDNSSTLEPEQKELVEGFPNKQIVIEGPAGSGKTVVLVRRAIYLAKKFPTWKIGIFCFSALMSNYLRHIFTSQEEFSAIHERIYIDDFFRYVSSKLEIKWDDSDKFFDQVKIAFESANKKLPEKFNAILIDEGQDCNDIQMRIYRELLIDDGAFTFFYDNRQNIFFTKNISEELGQFGFVIEKERSLVKQYRTSLIVLAILFFGLSDSKVEDKNPEHILESTNRMFVDGEKTILEIIKERIDGAKEWVQQRLEWARRGFKPKYIRSIQETFVLRKKENLEDICKDIFQEIENAISNNQASYKDFLILIPARKMDKISDVPSLILDAAKVDEIPLTYVDRERGEYFDGVTGSKTGDNRRKPGTISENTVKLMTIHTSKGYDADYVYILGLDKIWKSERSSVVYVALTRAVYQCVGYYSNDYDETVSMLKNSFDYIVKNHDKIFG